MNKFSKLYYDIIAEHTDISKISLNNILKNKILTEYFNKQIIDKNLNNINESKLNKFLFEIDNTLTNTEKTQVVKPKEKDNNTLTSTSISEEPKFKNIDYKKEIETKESIYNELVNILDKIKNSGSKRKEEIDSCMYLLSAIRRTIEILKTYANRSQIKYSDKLKIATPIKTAWYQQPTNITAV